MWLSTFSANKGIHKTFRFKDHKTFRFKDGPLGNGFLVILFKCCGNVYELKSVMKICVMVFKYCRMLFKQ